MDMSNALFGSKAKAALLSKLYSKPNETYHLRELVRSVGMGSGVVQREVEILTGAGFITKTTKGNRTFYQADSRSPLFEDVQSIVSKQVLESAPVVIRRALRTLKPRINAAFVYGSVARREGRPESDIDLMIVGDMTFEDIARSLTVAENRLHREINTTIYSASEFERKVKDGNHFLNTVVNGKKLFLIGEDSDIQRLGHFEGAR